MSQVHVTLPDGSTREVPKGTPVVEFAKSVLPFDQDPPEADATLAKAIEVLKALPR